jgi:hypothetical protein
MGHQRHIFGYVTVVVDRQHSIVSRYSCLLLVLVGSGVYGDSHIRWSKSGECFGQEPMMAVVTLSKVANVDMLAFGFGWLEFWQVHWKKEAVICGCISACRRFSFGGIDPMAMLICYCSNRQGGRSSGCMRQAWTHFMGTETGGLDPRGSLGLGVVAPQKQAAIHPQEMQIYVASQQKQMMHAGCYAAPSIYRRTKQAHSKTSGRASQSTRASVVRWRRNV